MGSGNQPAPGPQGAPLDEFMRRARRSYRRLREGTKKRGRELALDVELWARCLRWRPDWWYGYDPYFDSFLLPLFEAGGWVAIDQFVERVHRKYPSWRDADAERLDRWIATAVDRRLLEPASHLSVAAWGVTEEGRRRAARLSFRKWIAYLIGAVGITGTILGLFGVKLSTVWLPVGGVLLGLFVLWWFGLWLRRTGPPPAWKQDREGIWPRKWPLDRRPPPLPYH